MAEPAKATFISLPNELLETIFEQAETATSTILGLATTCTRLHFVCLSFYLKKHGQTEDSCSVSLHVQSPAAPCLDMLGVLLLSTFIQNVGNLRCRFSAHCSLERMVRNLARVERLIRRLNLVQHVVLNFSPEDKKYTTSSDGEIYGWCAAVNNVLDACLERGCKSLEVNGLNQMDDVYHLNLIMPRLNRPPATSFLSKLNLSSIFRAASAPLEQPTTTAFETILNGPTWKFERSARPSISGETQSHILAHLSPKAKLHSQLTDLTIGSKSLLCPPLLQWTCSVLSASPIHSLTIQNINFFGPNWFVLTTLLPQSAPTLRHLTLTNIGSFSHEQITSFMDSFPDLENLSAVGLGLPWYTGLTSDTVKQTFFPKFRSLRELRIEEHWFIPAFQQSFDSLSLPTLEILTVVFHSGEGWRKMDDRLSPVHLLFTEFSARGADLGFVVNIDIAANADVIGWMRTQNYRNAKAAPDEDDIWMQCVSGVYLLFGGRLQFDHELNAQSIVETWFKQFPGLKRVMINTKEIDDRTRSSAEEFCETTMIRVHKSLESLDVNGKAWVPKDAVP